MPHRNADGTFASGSKGYDDLEVQTIVTGLQTESANLTDLLEVFDQYQILDPAGGLARDEVAELVYLESKASAFAMNSDSSSSKGHFLVHGETSLDPVPATMPIMGDDVDENDVDGVTGVNSRLVDTTDPEKITSHTVGAGAGTADATNGQGSGDHHDTVEFQIPYRTLFGHGPTVDRHNNLYRHLGWNAGGGAIPQAQYMEKTTLVWDVYEED